MRVSNMISFHCLNYFSKQFYSFLIDILCEEREFRTNTSDTISNSFQFGELFTDGAIVMTMFIDKKRIEELVITICQIR